MRLLAALLGLALTAFAAFLQLTWSRSLSSQLAALIVTYVYAASNLSFGPLPRESQDLAAHVRSEVRAP